MSTKTNYTPGPWPAPQHDSSDHYAADWYEIHGIARVYDEDDANLIYASPDLFSALQAIVDNPDMADGEEPRRMIAVARVAIAKALGKEVA